MRGHEQEQGFLRNYEISTVLKEGRGQKDGHLSILFLSASAAAGLYDWRIFDGFIGSKLRILGYMHP